MDWYLEVWRKYAVFEGRARRKEYWMFALFNVIAIFLLGFIEGLLGNPFQTSGSVLAGVYKLAVCIPYIAVGVRRMHDTDHSGWWLLLPIVNLVFAVTEGTHGENRFGPDPMAGERVRQATGHHEAPIAPSL